MESNLLEIWRQTTILGLLGIVAALATTVYSAAYAWRPNESRLTLIRPLSLATIFAALCSFSVVTANIFAGLAVTGNFDITAWRAVAHATSWTFTSLFVAFGCLAISWLCVAIGMRRMS